LLGLIALLAIASVIQASSHGEAPGTAAMPASDGTDLYMFRSYESGRSGYVTFIANYNPRQLPYGGPNFYALDSNFYYYIYVDNTGDGIPELTFQFTIINELQGGARGIQLNIDGKLVEIALKAVGPISKPMDPNLNFYEFYKLNVINTTSGKTSAVSQSGNSKQTTFSKPFDNAGPKTIPNYSSYANQFIYNINIPNCNTAGRVFVGQRQESFSINLGKIFDLVNFVPINGTFFPTLPGITQNPTNNVIRTTNIDSFVLEVPIKCLTGHGNGVIASWTSSGPIAPHSNHQRYKSRMANPLINELFTGLKDKDKWNHRKPIADNSLLRYIFYPTFPQIINALFLPAIQTFVSAGIPTLAPVNRPRGDLILAFLQGIPGLNQLSQTTMVELLRLNTSTPITSISNQNPLGVIGGDNAGFPNGRRPGDDVIDIYLRVSQGVLCTLNIGCSPSQQTIGSVPLTDGSPIFASDFQNKFPYLNTPLPGTLAVPCSSISFGC